MVLRIALKEAVPVRAAVAQMKSVPAENVYRIRIREEIREIPAVAEILIPVSAHGELLHNPHPVLSSIVLQDNKKRKVFVAFLSYIFSLKTKNRENYPVLYLFFNQS